MTKKKIINILFNDFTNDNRVLKESLSLINNNYEVKLIATRFDKKNPKQENISGIDVQRVYVGPCKFLPINLVFFWLSTIYLCKKENIFHCNDLYALPPACVIKKLFKRQTHIVYDCHEHETEAGIYLGRPTLKALAKFIEKKLIKYADKVITVSESIAEDYVCMYGIEKPALVLNCPLYKKHENKDIFRKKFNISAEKVIFLFQGEYLKGRGVDKLIDIFKDLERKNPTLILVLLVYGNDLTLVQTRIKDRNNIYWHDKVPGDVYMEYVASCDWGIYLMENTCKNHNFALPNKLFDYVMAELPIVVSNLKEMSSFVENNKIGYAVDPENHQGIVKLLKGINSNTKRNFIKNVKSVAQKYSWQEQEKILINVYKSL